MIRSIHAAAITCSSRRRAPVAEGERPVIRLASGTHYIEQVSLVRGLERFFFWPTGVRSAGAMRQWGRHATAFVGRRHFDDADLLERRFELDLAAQQ